MIRRSVYLERVLSLVDSPVIKVLRGVRRCGKSVLLQQVRSELIGGGVPEDRVLLLNFESLSTAHLTTHMALYRHIVEWAGQAEGRAHILLDEIQLVDSWERAVNSLRVDLDCDLIITGSNAWLLSTELSTLLTGRYVELDVHPLSFAEHLDFVRATGAAPADDIPAAFDLYLRLGGMPGVHEMADESGALVYLRDVSDGIVLKDIVARHKLRDVDLLQRLLSFIMDNLGHTLSAKSVSGFLKSQRRSLGAETVYNYLHAAVEACLIHKAERYDIKGKRQLETLEKYFLADHGFAHAWLGYRPDEMPGVLENIVYLELLRRGYTVRIGRQGAAEVDFVADRQDKRLYVQVAYLLSDPAVVDREFAPLAQIADHHRKVVLSLDTLPASSRDGIERLYLPEFLLAADVRAD
ncbi:MAG: ATP-binding protein [Propionibacteriaceae bacterium]|jgi:predicted AAA+ superfamily ATPase|nr:ATP-binding protein [Propionibacteriaceae bacterium]